MCAAVAVAHTRYRVRSHSATAGRMIEIFSFGDFNDCCFIRGSEAREDFPNVRLRSRGARLRWPIKSMGYLGKRITPMIANGWVECQAAIRGRMDVVIAPYPGRTTLGPSAPISSYFIAEQDFLVFVF